MPRKPSLINVRSTLTSIESFAQDLLDNNYKHGANGVCLPPAYEHHLRRLRLIVSAILKKNTAKRGAGNRHGIAVGAK